MCRNCEGAGAGAAELVRGCGPMRSGLIRNWKRIVLWAKTRTDMVGMLGALEGLRQGLRTSWSRKGLLQEIEAFIPGWSSTAYGRETEVLEALRERRRIDAAKLTTAMARASDPLRNPVTFGVPNEAVQELARKYWNRTGRNKLKKRIVSGVVWGDGAVSTNGKNGWYRVVRSRYLGVQVRRGGDGRVGLSLVSPD